MGNKLCAPLWKKNYRSEDHPWAPKKDSHLLRLWAEIFQVKVEGDEMHWERVSDDVVPVNITCIQDSPETVFQITAYNRHVEKIFDVRLIQPGTKIIHASECFVHWKDSRSELEWGLNFTTPVDARRYKDCCMSPTIKLSRKASSSGSLRLSPPKRVRSKKSSTSQPSSPVTKPRRAISTPEELALSAHDAAVEAGFEAASDDRSPTCTTASLDSTRSGGTGIEAAATMPRTRQRQYQDVRQVYEQSEHGPSPGIPNPPYNTNNVYDSVTLPHPVRRLKQDNANQFNSLQRHIGQKQNNARYHGKSTLDKDNLKSILYGSQENLEEDDKQQRRFSKSELRTFSREPTVIRISALSKAEQPSDRDYPQLAMEELDAIQLSMKETYPEDTTSPLSPPHNKSHSSSSPEWPPPPEPITPISPEAPVVSTSFDSDTLKRMLRSLPACVQEEHEEYPNHAHHQPTSTASSPIRHNIGRMDSAGSRETESPPKALSGPTSQTDLINVQPKSQRLNLEYELQMRHSTARDSYPDSGVSGMTNDTTGSVRSGDSGRSGRSGRSSKSATLPPGLGLGYASKSGGSSGGSSSGRHSDLIQQLGVGSDTTEVRQLTASDISESGSESGDSDTGTSDSSIRTMPSESQASFASKSAAIRKAGCLIVKNWLIHRKRKIELAPKRSWKKYWVCLKGTMLLFHNVDEHGSVDENSVPRHMLVIEGGIAQAVPEHPKREHIFALSTAFGDAYLFQAPSQIEQENWISAIHSACASSFARQHGKDNTLKLLRSEIQKLENSIDIDIKMKKMADLQLSVVTDPKSRQAIEKQISQWDENLEKLYIEQYRLRCYMCSLQGSELPNPKTLLTYVSKGTKAVLGRIGVFTVTSFHALVYARTPLTAASLYSQNKKRGILSTFKADSVTRIRPRSGARPHSPQPGSRASTHSPTTKSQDVTPFAFLFSNQIYKNTDVPAEQYVDLSRHSECYDVDQPQAPPAEAFNLSDNLVRITLPNAQSIVCGVSDKMTVQEVLEGACNKRQLNPNDHFIRFKLQGKESFRIPDKASFMENEEYESIEVCPKILFQIELVKAERDLDFGFEVEAELAEDSENEDELCVFISEINKGGLAQKKGLIVGDEILVINGKVMSELDMVYVETMLQEASSLCMTVRSCRVERPVNTTPLMEHADAYIENMMCPPPPSQSRISDKVIGELIVPAPNWVQADKSSRGGSTDGAPRTMDFPQLSSAQIDNLLQGAEQVTHFCRLLHGPLQETCSDEDQPRIKPLSDAQKLRKVIIELVETERQYVKDLNRLIERYLVPLKEETFLSGEDIEQLFGNIQEIVQFQRLFLQSLEEAIELEPSFITLNQPKQFRDDNLRRVLFSIGGSFLYYANHFKLYSSFCASHSKAQKVLNPANLLAEGNSPLKEFLRARNPKQQHSATLESYLIKPIQRILKYPLLLGQLRSLTDPASDEHHHLAEALKGMEAVAEHINEMQKIYEEYGTIFDDLVRQYKEVHPHSRPLDLNIGELQMYGIVNWINPGEHLKLKRGTELVTTLFIFKTAVVLLSKERIKGKRRGKPPPGKQSMQPSENVEIVRYQTVVLVDQLQARNNSAGDTDKHGLWDLVHCKSETEGRPERVFQFASSLDAKSEFLKTIRNVIRESVRRMSLPGQHHKQPTNRSSKQNFQYCTKTLDSHHSKMSGSAEKKRSKQLKAAEMVRHSVDLDDNVPMPPDQQGLDFRTRSRTYGDLNNMDLQEGMGGSSQGPHGSQSTIGSDQRSGSSAKLLHSSNNPINYSSTNINKDVLGSPIWKPRHLTKRPAPLRSPLSSEERTLESTVFSGNAYSDYSNIMYDENHGSITLTPPNTYIEHEDTEC